MLTVPPSSAQERLREPREACSWMQGEEAPLRQAVLLPSLFLAAALFVLLMADTLNTTSDDIATLYSHGFGFGDAQAQNLRFFAAGAGWFLDRLGIGYFQLIGLWALLFAGSIWLLGHEVARTLGFGFFGSAWIGAAAAAHGFMAELYSFTAAYMIYAAAMAGAALLLHGLRLRRERPRLAFALGAAGAFICLGSYQPLILVPAFAFGLKVMQGNLTEDRPFLPWRDALFLAACAALAAFAIFACVLLRSSGLPAGLAGGRLSLAAAAGNWTSYLLTITDVLLSFRVPFESHVPYERLSPAFERVFYLAAILFLLVLPAYIGARAQSRRDWGRAAAAFGTAVCLLLLVPGVFNLFCAFYWPTPRSMISVVFFEAAAAALAVRLVLRSPRAASLPLAVHRRTPVLLALAGGFLALSCANQASAWFARALQARADIQAATAVVAALRSRTPLDGATAVSVHATWRNFAQRPTALLDYNLSAFSQPWSQVPLLRLASGVPLREAQLPPGACDGFHGDYEIRQVKEIWAVCME